MSKSFSRSSSQNEDRDVNHSNGHGDQLQVPNDDNCIAKEQTCENCDTVNNKEIRIDEECLGDACECSNAAGGGDEEHLGRPRCRLNTLTSRRSFRLASAACAAGGDNGDHLGLKRMSPPPRHPSIILHRTDHRRSLERSECELVDGFEEKHMSFEWYEQIAIIFSICTFLGDIGTDILVASIHYLNEDYWYMALTLAFVLIPTLVMTGISLRWYILDAREETSPEVGLKTWILRVVLLLFQLGPILRYIDSFKYGIRFKKHNNPKDKKRYYTYMVYEDTDAAFLRLFECYMEAAPQLVLQLYIFAKKAHDNKNKPDEPPDNVWTVLTQIATIMTSLVSVSWSLVSYNRALRMCMEDKANLNWKGIAAQFLWRFFVIAARVLALALFASVFRFYISIVCGIHWILMLIWIRWMNTSFCDNPIEEFGYNAILACMFIFCYFNPVDSPTRYRYTAYYIFMFCENSLLMALWFFDPSTQTLWYHIPGLVGHYASFFTGLVFMAIYYLIFHPSQNIKLCPRRKSIDSSKDSEETRLKAGSVSGQSGGGDQANSKKPQSGYKMQMENGDPQKVWTTQGRILHPRPAQPVVGTSYMRGVQGDKLTPDSSRKDKKKGAKSPKEASPMSLSDRDLNKSSTDPQLALTSNHEISLSSTSCNNVGHQMKDTTISLNSDSGRTIVASTSENNTSIALGAKPNATTHLILSNTAVKSGNNLDSKAPVTCV